MISSILLLLVVLVSRVSAYRVDLFHDYEYLGIQRSFVRCHWPFHIRVEFRCWCKHPDNPVNTDYLLHSPSLVRKFSLTNSDISGVHVIEFPAKSWIWDVNPGEDCCVLFCVAGRTRVCTYNDRVTTSLDVPSFYCQSFLYAASSFYSCYSTPHLLASFPSSKAPTSIFFTYRIPQTLKKK
jgi:hypothetical protein